MSDQNKHRLAGDLGQDGLVRLCSSCQVPVIRGDERRGRYPGFGRVFVSLAQLAGPDRRCSDVENV
jgi:hypothetical protein